MFETIFDYLDNHYGEKEGVYWERTKTSLQNALLTYGLITVKDHIRSRRRGINFKLVKVGDEYFFDCMVFNVKDTERWVTLDYFKRHMKSYTLSLDGKITKRTLASHEKHLQTIINGFSLYDWIMYGHECEDCGTPFITTNTNITICTSCSSSYELREYNYCVESELGFEETKETRFGIELEYEDITARDVGKTLKGHALAKRDGSITSGVEIVTRPACIKTHKDKLNKFFTAVKVQAQPTTGMHVHIEKNKLSQYQIGFIMQFLNEPSLQAGNELIAGREYRNNHYCRPDTAHKMTYGISFQGYGKPLNRSETTKYSPVNTRKRHTIEIRIFSSPESHLECCAKLDFVNALVKYSSPYSVSVKTLKDKFSWPIFLKYIQDNRKEFIDFHNYYIKSNKLEGVGL